MNEQSPISGQGPLSVSKKAPVSANSSEVDISFEFERIFARRMVEQMTKNLFEEDTESGVMSTSSSMYKDHITDVLSSELAKQEALGIAEVVRNYRNRQLPNSESESLKIKK